MVNYFVLRDALRDAGDNMLNHAVRENLPGVGAPQQRVGKAVPVRYAGVGGIQR